MYKLTDSPSPKAKVHELADYIEIECIRNKKVSVIQMITALERGEDHFHTGELPENDPLQGIINGVLNEIDKRRLFCGNRYPFKIINQNNTIGIDNNISKTIHDIYISLLFATRLDMKTHRKKNQIDGSLAFEELSEYVGRNYLGERSESYLFGTASGEKNFENKINHLTKKLLEGEGFYSPDEKPTVYKKDGGLDVVIWKPFSDQKYGKLIGFGQCKTGTNWENHLTILNPDAFCDTWFKKSPSVKPVNFFFVSESLSRNNWYEQTRRGGILFDRCRIMDYLSIDEKNPPPFLTRIKTWNEAVKKEVLEL